MSTFLSIALFVFVAALAIFEFSEAALYFNEKKWGWFGLSAYLGLIVDVDVTVFSDCVIEKTVQDLKEGFLPSITDAFKSEEVSLPATGYLEVVTKYE